MRAKIFGRVQGVFFREHTKNKAQDLGLVGFVRNEENGSVYLEAQGSEEKLKDLLDWCHQGSPNANVENIEAEFISSEKKYTDFIIEG